MNIQKNKDQFSNKKINKLEFIESMHEYHKILFDFAKNLRDTEIARIEISDNNVIFSTRNNDFHSEESKFYVDILDKRVTPIEAFNFNTYEKEDSEMLYRLVKSEDIIFDIGANIGWYSIHLAKMYKNATIYAFEPIPETFNQLKKNSELNRVNNIVFNNFALSDKTQILPFFYSPNVTGAASSLNIIGDDKMLELSCQSTTIDNYVIENKINKLDFIKCDVEGAELMVFKGGVKSIMKFKPVVFSEMLRKWAAKFGYHPNDIIIFFKELGYNCYVTELGKLKLMKIVDDETIETNFFFLHEHSHSDIILKLS